MPTKVVQGNVAPASARFQGCSCRGRGFAKGAPVEVPRGSNRWLSARGGLLRKSGSCRRNRLRNSRVPSLSPEPRSCEAIAAPLPSTLHDDHGARALYLLRLAHHALALAPPPAAHDRVLSLAADALGRDPCQRVARAPSRRSADGPDGRPAREGPASRPPRHFGDRSCRSGGVCSSDDPGAVGDHHGGRARPHRIPGSRRASPQVGRGRGAMAQRLGRARAGVRRWVRSGRARWVGHARRERGERIRSRARRFRHERFGTWRECGRAGRRRCCSQTAPSPAPEGPCQDPSEALIRMAHPRGPFQDRPGA